MEKIVVYVISAILGVLLLVGALFRERKKEAPSDEDISRGAAWFLYFMGGSYILTILFLPLLKGFKESSPWLIYAIPIALILIAFKIAELLTFSKKKRE